MATDHEVERLCLPTQRRTFQADRRRQAELLLARGLNDHEILAKEFIVYDALYAECRRRMAESGKGSIFRIVLPSA